MAEYYHAVWLVEDAYVHALLILGYVPTTVACSLTLKDLICSHANLLFIEQLLIKLTQISTKRSVMHWNISQRVNKPVSPQVNEL